MDSFMCWLAILALMFFECFYRKLKSKFNRDVQPPRSLSSHVSSQEGEHCGEELSSELAPHYRHYHRYDRNNNRGAGCGGGGGGRFIGPISITYSSKEMCRISMEMGQDDEEEPPPSYEEALSYAKLITKFQFSPYGDSNIHACEVIDSTNNGDVGLCSTSSILCSNDPHHSNSDSCTSAKSPITVTTAAFPTNEENENSEEDDESEASSDSLTDIESDTETLINDRFQLASRITNDSRNNGNTNNDECNVIVSSSLSISKNLDCFDTNVSFATSGTSTVKMKGTTT